jgi:DNA-binding response OmpR family regulator
MTDDLHAVVLLVEDDEPTAAFLADNLLADGFEPVLARTVAEALAVLERQAPDVAVVDVTLPDGSGLDLLRRVRAADGIVSRLDPSLPVLLLSGLDGELDRLRGFERGCDDYVGKPFSYNELLRRIQALLRRTQRARRGGRVRVGALEIDAASRTAFLRGKPLDLSHKEFQLLRVLAADPTRVVTKQELLRAVWGHRAVGVTRTLDSHCCRLRTKLGADGDRFVVNVWGVGYRLVDVAEVAA